MDYPHRSSEKTSKDKLGKNERMYFGGAERDPELRMELLAGKSREH